MSRRSSIGGRRDSTGLMANWSCRAAAAEIDRTAARAPRLQKSSGFTLLEIIVVLALGVLIIGLLLGGSASFLRTMGKDDAENIALNAIAGARHSAVLTGKLLELHYDDQARTFDWGEGTAAFTGEGNARLLPAVKTSAMLVGGQAVEAPLARVRFYPDGTCDPFRLEIIRDKTSQILVMDPWTCTALAPETAPGQH
jgi:type II secretory pathway pseudopilin PulG